MAKEIFTEADEVVTELIMDVFDSENKGRLDVTYLYVLFVLALALENKAACLLRFLHKFGKVFFEMASTKHVVTYEKIVSLSVIVLDKTSVEVQRMLQRVGIDKNTASSGISWNDWEIYWYDVVKGITQSTSALHKGTSQIEGGRVYCFEYDPEKSTTPKFYDIKKHPNYRNTSAHPGLGGGPFPQTSGSIKCTLI